MGRIYHSPDKNVEGEVDGPLFAYLVRMMIDGKHVRRSIRLRDYDYSSVGAYFVTICAANRNPLFGKIVDGVMQMNDAGKMVQSVWDELPRH